MVWFGKKKKNGRSSSSVDAASRRNLSSKATQAPPATTPTTLPVNTPSLLSTIVVDEEFEAMTPETQRIVARQREEIRKQLFESDEEEEEEEEGDDVVEEETPTEMRRVATDYSQEVTSGGDIIDAEDLMEDFRFPRFASAPPATTTTFSSVPEDEVLVTTSTSADTPEVLESAPMAVHHVHSEPLGLDQASSGIPSDEESELCEEGIEIDDLAPVELTRKPTPELLTEPQPETPRHDRPAVDVQESASHRKLKMEPQPKDELPLSLSTQAAALIAEEASTVSLRKSTSSNTSSMPLRKSVSNKGPSLKRLVSNISPKKLARATSKKAFKFGELGRVRSNASWSKAKPTKAAPPPQTVTPPKAQTDEVPPPEESAEKTVKPIVEESKVETPLQEHTLPNITVEEAPKPVSSAVEESASLDDEPLLKPTLKCEPKVEEADGRSGTMLVEEKKEDDSYVARVVTPEAVTRNDSGVIDEGSRSAHTGNSLARDDETNKSEEKFQKPEFLPRKLLNAMQCTGDTTLDTAGCQPLSVVDLFYDKVCQRREARELKRPYYNEEFTLEFLHLMMVDGITVLSLQPPNTPENPTNDWKGRTVTMVIEPGTTGDDQNVQPKLEWTTAAGGQQFEVLTTSVSLLGILSINSRIDEEKEDDDDVAELCFFTITTNTGDVHVFEANSTGDRDRIVNGLRNVIARLSFHLIAGDATASAELYCDDALPEGGTNPAELPTLAKPHMVMNRLSHALLD